jgi:signal transduction histidine kinase
LPTCPAAAYNPAGVAMTLHALYRIADLVAHVRHPADIYEPAVDAMIAATQADRASILVFDEAGVMRFKAWRALSEGYRRAVDGHSPWTAGTKSPAPIWIPDVAGDLSLGPLRETILAEGIRALGFIPLGHHGRLLGKFMVYYDTPRDFSDVDLKVAEMVAHYVGFGLDRGRAEAAIEELLERERTARREAESANHAKDDFLAMLSHELRNPLNALVNAVDVLEQTGDHDAVAAKARAVLRRQTAHLARLLDDLLDAAKIGRGHLEIRPEPTDLCTVARQAVDHLSHRFDAKRQTLRVSLPDRPVTVKGDPARLEQVIGNLLDNASKYTPERGSIWLALHVESDEAILRVKDTGDGIPADRLRTIFDPFTQVNPTIARSAGGLGVGLSIVKRIVEMHRGSVEAQSEGRGAEFTVRLPVVAELPPPIGEVAPPLPAPRRIVLIEDNDDGREATTMALKVLGHDVQAANSGRAGIELALQCRPDLVLIDIGLPDLDGYEVARALRLQVGDRVKLVALTGYGQESDRKRSASAGFDAHLVKPVAPADLVRVLQVG